MGEQALQELGTYGANPLLIEFCQTLLLCTYCLQ